MAQTGCVIFAKDIEVLSQFYQSVLLMELIEKKASHHVLSNSTVELVIHGIPKKIAANITINSPPELRESTAMKPAFVVSSLDVVRKACAGTNGGLYPKEKIWDIRGAKVLDGWDPEGNVIQFKQFEE